MKAKALAPIMEGSPVQAPKKPLRRRGRMDIAVTKHGLSNLDVKRNWSDPAATSDGLSIPEPDAYPAVAFRGPGLF